MDVRQKMVKWRRDNGLSKRDVAGIVGCSTELITIVEEGGVTHPNIVERIAYVYNLTELEAEELLPLNRRLHGGHYDPDKYAPLDLNENPWMDHKQMKEVKWNTFA